MPNSSEFSDDLLYKCPSYPILNYTDDYICLGINRESIVIKNYLSLSEILEYLKYPEELNINDILRIRNTLFSGRFAKDNARIFGLKELIPDSFKAFKNEAEITDYNKRLKEYQKTLTIDSEREYIDDKEGLLSKEYMELIDSYGNKLINGELIDTFASVPGEGKIKKLLKN